MGKWGITETSNCARCQILIAGPKLAVGDPKIRGQGNQDKPVVWGTCDSGHQPVKKHFNVLTFGAGFPVGPTRISALHKTAARVASTTLVL